MSLPEKCRQCGRLSFPGDTVTVPAEEYEELRRFKEARTPLPAKVGVYRQHGGSRIARDPELAAFIVSCNETMILADVHRAAVERFGKERVPHRSSIYRFLYGSDAVRGGGFLGRKGR